MKITKKIVLKKLEQVMDPELNISVVDLGLIYDVIINKDNKTKIVMTLTAIGCPLIDMIQSEIIDRLVELGISKNNISIKVTFDPPWKMEKMSKKGRKLLGI